MNKHRMILWAAAAFILICIVVISTPNLLRSRMAADEASLVAKSRNATTSEAQVATSKLSLFVGSPNPEKKLIHNAELGLVVNDVRAAADQIRRLTESNHGEIDKVEMIETSTRFLSATLA